ncbi:uncharacterized protein ATC70_004002 [Mucor velutinosus]|uniref:Uncharacterized protein n=1 Tax=Mucor velutinosus TaxID=708070 RepID=A0AAN7HXH5_9FUNG|nr:hypothetical protein ATC70_004002 [Mucor velutinosus]
MSSSSSQADNTYDSVIELALQLVPRDANFTLSTIINCLHDDIVDVYNGDEFDNYRRSWIRRVFSFCRSKGTDLPNSQKANWDKISATIIDRLVSGVISTTSSSSSNSISTDDAVPVKHKLTNQDKQKIKNMYIGLDKTKMWKLSTGKVVEEEMMKLAISKDHEHLCHSLIMDVRDRCWNDYFSPAEMEEIKSYKALQLPVLPSNVTTYMEELLNTPRDQLYTKVNEVTFAPNTHEYWIQDSYNNAIRLVQSGFFPLRDVTEQGMGRRMWSCVDKCFDFAAVRCVTREKCSKASTDAANSVRSPSDCSRQQTGRKMDYLFKIKESDIEISCGECALVGGVNTRKEFRDAGFKMPKVMKDMLGKIVSTSPGVLHRLHISGLFIAAETLTLYLLDSPQGYVTRYDAFNSVSYPVTEAMIRSKMPALLTMILSSRIMMENVKIIIDEDESLPILGRFMPVVMEPCFAPVRVNCKKGKAVVLL